MDSFPKISSNAKTVLAIVNLILSNLLYLSLWLSVKKFISEDIKLKNLPICQICSIIFNCLQFLIVSITITNYYQLAENVLGLINTLSMLIYISKYYIEKIYFKDYIAYTVMSIFIPFQIFLIPFCEVDKKDEDKLILLIYILKSFIYLSFLQNILQPKYIELVSLIIAIISCVVSVIYGKVADITIIIILSSIHLGICVLTLIYKIIWSCIYKEDENNGNITINSDINTCNLIDSPSNKTSDINLLNNVQITIK